MLSHQKDFALFSLFLPKKLPGPETAVLFRVGKAAPGTPPVGFVNHAKRFAKAARLMELF